MNENGILLTGQSGAGKSTISSALYSKGYRMLTDDVAPVGIDGHEVPMVYPSFPGQKLWEDAIERIGRNEEKKPLNRIMDDMNKYSITSVAYFCNEPKPIKVIIEIIPDSVDQIGIQELKGLDKLNLITRNAYRRRFPQVMGLQEWNFRQCVAVANHITAYQIRRPRNLHLENEIAELIKETVL